MPVEAPEPLDKQASQAIERARSGAQVSPSDLLDAIEALAARIRRLEQELEE